MKNQLVSASRLPLDHFISGALVGAMSGFAIGYDEPKKNGQKASLFKTTAKMAIGGGVVGAAGIGAANAIVQKNFTKAALITAGGIASLVLLENLLPKDKI